MNRIITVLILLVMNVSLYSNDELVKSIKAQYENEQYKEIIAEHSDKLDGYSAKAVCYVGKAYYMVADDDNCLKTMDLSIAKDDSDPDPYYIKGMTYNYMGQFQKALQLLEKAIELNPEKSHYHSGLGDSLYSLNDLGRALEAYITATKKDKPIERPFVMIPQIYADMNDPESSLKSLYNAKNHISKKSRSYISVLYNIGLNEYLNKNYDDAEASFKELLEIDPNDYHTFSKLIQVYYGKKQFEKAAPIREILYDAHKKGILENNLKHKFCFDQFEWNDKLILVFERFNESDDKIYYKHIFYVTKDNKVEYQIQTEFSPIAMELENTKYLLGMNKDDTHYTFNIGFKEDFNYLELKKTVIEILEGNIKPVSSSVTSK